MNTRIMATRKTQQVTIKVNPLASTTWRYACPSQLSSTMCTKHHTVVENLRPAVFEFCTHHRINTRSHVNESSDRESG